MFIIFKSHYQLNNIKMKVISSKSRMRRFCINELIRYYSYNKNYLLHAITNRYNSIDEYINRKVARIAMYHPTLTMNNIIRRKIAPYLNLSDLMRLTIIKGNEYVSFINIMRYKGEIYIYDNDSKAYGVKLIIIGNNMTMINT